MMNFKIFLSLVVAFAIAENANSQTIFSGCTQTTTGSIFVTCSVNNGQFPSRVSTGVIATVIETLIIQNQNSGTIPDNSFSGLTINNLIMSTNSLTSITANAFTGTTKLTSATFGEQSLNSIVATAFTAVRSTLTTLSFAESSMTVSRFTTIKDGIQTLTGLTSLTLDNNQLISLNSGWFNGLTGLQKFSAKTNQIADVQADTFKFNTALTDIDLSSNSLADMTKLITALTPVASTLEKLTLSLNKFTTINDFASFRALKTLILSQNLIASISSTNSFSNLPALTQIDLSTNSLTAVPAITNQLQLISLDVSTNKITTIADNAFSRSAVPTNGVNLKLNGQTITSFSNSAFCSALDPFYTQIEIDDASLTNFNKCFFKQLKPANAGLRVNFNVVVAPGQTSTFCNCNNKVFANTNQVDLTGACASFTDACSTTNYVDDCAATYTCARATATSSANSFIKFEYMGFIIINSLLFLVLKQF